MDTGVDDSEPSVAFPQVPIRRPTGVTLIASCYFVVAAMFFIAAATFWRHWVLRENDRPDLAILGFLYVIVGLAIFALGRFLLELRDWVRILTIALAGFVLLKGGEASDWWLRVVALATIAYLMSANVKSAFQAATVHDRPALPSSWFVG